MVEVGLLDAARTGNGRNRPSYQAFKSANTSGKSSPVRAKLRVRSRLEETMRKAKPGIICLLAAVASFAFASTTNPASFLGWIGGLILLILALILRARPSPQRR